MLSVIIITKNEEDVIGNCIKSIRDIADEIIVVDSNSSDQTVEIAEKEKAVVIKNRLVDFSDQRNFALRKAQGDWIFYIDADEKATQEFKKELLDTIKNYNENSGIGGYYIKRKIYYYGIDWGLMDRVQRLFYRKYFREWKGPVHETPVIEGKFAEISSPIIHNTRRSFERMVDKTNDWSEYEAEARFRTHHPKMNVLRFVRIMLTGFLKSYISEKGYKNGTAGLIEAMYQAFSMFITYAKLWERQQTKKI